MIDYYHRLLSLITSARRRLRSEGFLRTYGRNILKIESLLVIIATLTFIIQFFLPAYIVGVSITAWLIAFVAAIVFHQLIFRRIAERETCPYEILRQLRYRSYFFRAIILSVLIFILLLYIWVCSIRGEILTDFSSGNIIQGFVGIALFVLVIALFFMVAFPLAFSAYFLYLVPIRNYNKARLIFRTAIVGFALIRKEEKKAERAKLVKKYIPWFRDGLRSYNKHLYETNPAHLEIIDPDMYYHNVSSVASIGSPDEQTIILSQLRCGLDSITGKFTEDDPKRFLIALKNISHISQKKEYPSYELYEMIRPKTLLERIKDAVKSPIAAGLLSLIPIVAALVTIMSNLNII